MHITVSKASQSAIKAIERLNGSLVERYENRLTLVCILVSSFIFLPDWFCTLQRALINPDSFHRRNLDIPGKADPVARRDLIYYADSVKHRGYLGLRAADKTDKEVREAAAEAFAEQEHGQEQPQSA